MIPARSAPDRRKDLFINQSALTGRGDAGGKVGDAFATPASPILSTRRTSA